MGLAKDADLVKAIKEDIEEGDTASEHRTYQILDDGTLVVHIWNRRMLSPESTRIVNITIGREVKREEWSVKLNG